jgi:4-amino-4-deoxychorismate lyase
MTVRALAVQGRGLVEPTEPVLCADDEGFTRGRAAFETMRVYDGTAFRLAQHLSRLESSARQLGLPPIDRSVVERLAEQAVASAQLPAAVLRVYWAAGRPGARAFAVAAVAERPPGVDGIRARGLKIVSLLGVRATAPWLLPGTKSTSYAVNIAAEAEARRRGADDALFVDAGGIVLEGPVTNIWWRRGSTLFTPELALGILAGETRATVMELAPGLGLEIAEGAYPLGDVAAAEEVFTSSSVRELLPVIELDGAEIPRGPVIDDLQGALRRVAGRHG